MSLAARPTRALLLVAAFLLLGGAAWLFARGGDDRAEPPAGPPGPTAASPPGDPDRVTLEGFDEVAVRVDPLDGSALLAWCLLAALDPAARSRGLMEVTDLQGYSGMVFVYDEDVDNAFYMRNTPTPLSIAWVAADGEVLGTGDMAPCEDRGDCPTYPPPGPYRYAVEVFQGDLANLGITTGATVTVGGACAARA